MSAREKSLDPFTPYNTPLNKDADLNLSGIKHLEPIGEDEDDGNETELVKANRTPTVSSWNWSAVVIFDWSMPIELILSYFEWLNTDVDENFEVIFKCWIHYERLVVSFDSKRYSCVKFVFDRSRIFVPFNFLVIHALLNSVDCFFGHLFYHDRYDSKLRS